MVLGSSTAAGFGASRLDSSWVARLRMEFEKNSSDGVDTSIINLAHGGFSSYKIMPTGFVPSMPNRPAPSNDSNLTKAFTYNPDIILISLPSNDVASGYSVQEEMNNLRYLVQIMKSHGINYFIATSQPRNDLDYAHRVQLRGLTDSINTNFTPHVLNFWDDLVSTDGSLKIRTDLTPDGIHPNDQGHRYLYQRVLGKSIFKADAGQPSFSLHTKAVNYVRMLGVGTETTSDVGGGLNVGYIDPGDWMEYSVTVPSAGNYKMLLRIATPANNASLEVRKADGSILAKVNLPNTGGFQTWQTISTTITLSQGIQTIRIISTSPLWNNWNINWFDLNMDAVVGTQPPPPPSPVPPGSSTPIHIEAEDYVSMFGVATEKTTDVGGGLNVSYIDPGDWMDYKINVPLSGSYKINFRVASPANYGQLQVKKADGTILATVNLPNTGGFQTWQTKESMINLVQGLQTIRLLCTSPPWNNWNINWFELSYFGNINAITASPKSFAITAEKSESPLLIINKIFTTSDRVNAELLVPNDKSGEVSIYSLSGALISKERQLFSGPISYTSNNIKGLRPGVYILSVVTQTGKSSKQFILGN
ncbi:MAG: hypothetical protein NVS1B13_03980 [Flavisolibacter sp.]